MSFEQNGGHFEGGALDADAVCADCATVNPEGTFLCKDCGNNLREQKIRRSSENVAADVLVESPGHSAWLRKAVVILGALLALYLAVNATNIAGVLVGAHSSFEPKRMWRGEMGDIYESLLPRLRPRGHCVINVPDMWWENHRITIHISVIDELRKRGYELRNIIIWDRTNIVNRIGIFGWPSNYITMGVTFEYLLDFWRPPIGE